MRLRNETLRTGDLLAWFAPEDRSTNRSLLFLVTGAADIEPLREIEAACRRHIDSLSLVGFEWHAVPDQGQLASVDPLLNSSQIFGLEVCELAGLSQEDLDALLGPALERMASRQTELFPSAGGAVGAPAEGIQLLGRTKELSMLLEALRSGRDLLLLAPRRSGKTSVLRRLEKSLEGQFRTLYLDLERYAEESDVAARFRMLATGESFRLAQRRSEEGWEDLLKESLQALGHQSPSQPLLLLLDELVFFLQNLQEARDEDLSRYRQKVQHFLSVFSEACNAAGARVVIAGSLDLGDFLRESLGIKLPEISRPLGSLDPFPLPPLSLDSPALEMRRVLLGTGLVPEPGDLDWLVENADLATPYAALQFLDRLTSRVRAEGRLGRERIEAVLDEFLALTDAFRDFDERLRRKSEQISGARAAVREALDLLAEADPDLVGVSEEQIRQVLERVPGKGEHLLAWFFETYPIRRQGDRLLFASRLFGRWWNRQLVEGGKRR